MSNDVIIDQGADNTPAPVTPNQSRRPNIAKIMSTALAPYSAVDNLSEDAIYTYRDLLEREGGTLKVLKHLPERREDRFRLHCRAHEAIETFPPHRQMAEAYRGLKKAIETKPTSRERKLMIGLMLDGLGIRAGDEIDGYIEMLCYALADIDPAGHQSQRWIPLSAIARTVRQVVTTHGETYGRPPPISLILKHCESNLFELKMMKSQFDRIGLALINFHKIAKSTEDSYPNEMWDF